MSKCYVCSFIYSPPKLGTVAAKGRRRSVLKTTAKIKGNSRRRFPLFEKDFPYFENTPYQYVTKAVFDAMENINYFYPGQDGHYTRNKNCHCHRARTYRIR